MLEANTFRTMMLVGGVMVLAVLIAGFFTLPIVEMEPNEKVAYERIMDADLGDKNSLTGYQAVHFFIEGKTRGNVQHY